MQVSIEMAPADEQQELERLKRENRLLKGGIEQAERMHRLWQEALDQLGQAREQLKAQNRRLTSLYQAASSLAHTTEQERLFSDIMDAMEQLIDLPRSYPMGIFLIEEDGQMTLAANRLGSDQFCQAHEQMQVGDCLCGRAALGEVIITRNCGGDPRHTLNYVHPQPHGHFIFPLTAKGRNVGVFYYYLPAGFVVDDALKETFIAIGSQLGLAIENARLYAATLELTTRDPLTGLGNRRFLHEALQRDLHNVARYQGTLSVVMLDIDYFKRYNDTNGHLEGDRLLAQIGGILREVVRTGDLPVRFGGEEFMVLLPQTDLQSAGRAAERIRLAVEEQSPVTVSLGVASVSASHCEPSALIEAADSALYRAKEAGRNRVEISEKSF